MLSLILVRHAKSSWDLPDNDKQRKLTAQGENTIRKVAILVKDEVSEEFSIWSSSAVRTMSTASLFCDYTGLDKKSIVFKDDLYTFSVGDLERIIKQCENSVKQLILFGHNEAITDFVNKFGDINVDNVPTAGLVYLQFDVDCWENINKGKIIKHIFPKELD
ncbi:SixA phosphatase family protein [Flavobacterium sp.]|uniref:SixA phosphatase family protein n=1 Tax=Flavobacterium sp. TaxID=239 RepID=UPI003D101396